MSALLHRVTHSPFARDVREFLPAFAIAVAFLLTLLVGVKLGMAVDDLAVIVDPATGQTLVVDTEARR